jgi:FkbM family methyltransferase
VVSNPLIEYSIGRRTVSYVIERLPKRTRLALKNWHYSRLILYASQSADPDLRGAQRLIRRGDTVLDVGANVGLWTHFLSKWVGGVGRVWSFEPIPETFAILSECIRRLADENVVPINIAVSDCDTDVQMIVPLDERGIRNYHLATIASPGVKGSFTLAGLTLERWHDDNGSPPVSFVKIDTEQHELACVRGAMPLIRDCLPALCIEISSDLSDPESDGAAIAHLLQPLEYDIYIWDKSDFAPLQVGKRSVNYFFLRPEHVEHARLNALS